MLDAKAPEAQPYRHLDLNHDWRLAHAATWAAAESLLPLDDAAAGPQAGHDDPLGRGREGGRPLRPFIARTSSLPPRWETQSTLQLAVRGDIHDSQMHGFAGRNAIYLNGQPLWSGDRIDTRWFDVTAASEAGPQSAGDRAPRARA